MNPKRIRSLNWDEEEKDLFRFILKEYAQIIENKSLDTNTNKLKAKAWEDIHKKFNELNVRNRHLTQLKIQWKTMKLNNQKKYCTFKQNNVQLAHQGLKTVMVPKQNVIKRERTSQSKQDSNEYIDNMINLSKTLKEKEHQRRMEIMDKEHSINMAIAEENLKSAKLIQEILEIKKRKEDINI